MVSRWMFENKFTNSSNEFKKNANKASQVDFDNFSFSMRTQFDPSITHVYFSIGILTKLHCTSRTMFQFV